MQEPPQSIPGSHPPFSRKHSLAGKTRGHSACGCTSSCGFWCWTLSAKRARHERKAVSTLLHASWWLQTRKAIS